MINSTSEKSHEQVRVMRKEFYFLFFLYLFSSICISGFAQNATEKTESSKAVIDSLKNSGIIFHENQKRPEINLSREQAVEFLKKRTRSKYWNNPKDPLRLALNQLLFEASHQRFDSAEYYLKEYPYDSLLIPWDKFYIWEPLRLKIPVISVPEFPMTIDSIPKTDTTFSAENDSVKLKLSALPQNGRAAGAGLKDTTIMVVIDTLDKATSDIEGFPFKYFDFPYQGDSIKFAVQSLLDYVAKRDSSVINFTGAGKTIIPVWMNSGKKEIMRYWLQNEFSDSVTIWIGNESKNTIGLYLEQGINFRKPAKQGNYSEARINVQKIDHSKLLKPENIVLKKHYWKYRTESALLGSQSALSNWVKGGENSVSAALDLTGYADFVRPELKLSSANFARLKLGFLKSGGNWKDIRKNLDLLETNSKLNHKAFGKFDFSAIMLFKTQIAVGKAYTKVGDRDSSYVVSRFFNPAIITIGIGLDYKPNKETSINFSPLSYKGTFVPAGRKMDKTTRLQPGEIDQTRYGIPFGRKSLNEPGASFMINKISRPFKNLTVTNRLQLFTNYIHNPQNIDVDWEMIAVTNINWFTELRLNTHLIFDDDTKTVEMDEDGITPKKTARIQFKEMLGVSLMFRF